MGGRRMMTILEPCCIDTQFGKLLEEVRKTNAARNFIGYGDWNAARLMEVSIPYVAGGFVGISTGEPTNDFIAAVRRQLSRPIDGYDDRPSIQEMVWIMPPCSAAVRKEVKYQLKDFIRSKQLTVVEDVIGMRCYMVMGQTYQFIISGNMYMTRCSGVLQFYTLQTGKESATELLSLFRTEAKLRPSISCKSITSSAQPICTEQKK